MANLTPTTPPNVLKRSPITIKEKLNRQLVQGFTLLEILIAALILALVMTGLASIFLAGKRHLAHTRSKIQAAELGKLFLAPLQQDVRQDQWEAGTNCLSSNGSAGCPGAQTVDNITYTPNYNISDLSGTTLKKVKVTINWTEPSP